MGGSPGSAGASPLLPALYWFNYELVREWLCAQARLDEATFMISFASGAISGTVRKGSWGLQPPPQGETGVQYGLGLCHGVGELSPARSPRRWPRC